ARTTGRHRDGCARGPAEAHIAAGEAADRLAEDRREVDRTGVGGIRLACGLVDRHRRRDSVHLSGRIRTDRGGLVVARLVGGAGVETVAAITLGSGIAEATTAGGGRVRLHLAEYEVGGALGPQLHSVQPGGVDPGVR